MRIKKKLLYIFAFLLIIAIAVEGTFYFFPDILTPHSIQVIDKSNVYDIKGHNSPLFSKYLNDWGVWKPKNFTIDGQRYYTIKKIIITLSDVNKGRYSTTDVNGKTVASTTGSIQNNTLFLNLYLSPDLLKTNDIKTAEGILLLPFIQQIYNPNHKTQALDQKLKSIEPALQEMQSKNALPYTISKQKN